MQSLLAKLAALVLLGAGFAVTGDLRRLAERGARFLNATAVPTGDAGVVDSPPTPGPVPPAHMSPETPAAPASHRDAPLGRPVDIRRLPISTLETVDLGTLAPGARLTVWAGTPPAAMTFDVVDPATGEVLEQAAAPAGTGPDVVSRRLRLEGAAERPTRIDRGGMMRLTPLGVAYGGRPAGPVDTLGPVRAIEVK